MNFDPREPGYPGDAQPDLFDRYPRGAATLSETLFRAAILAYAIEGDEYGGRVVGVGRGRALEAMVGEVSDG